MLLVREMILAYRGGRVKRRLKLSTTGKAYAQFHVEGEKVVEMEHWKMHPGKSQHASMQA